MRDFTIFGIGLDGPLGHNPSETRAYCPRTYAHPQDQHDAIDLTDNSVTTLANFPLMRRLRSLHLANNHIVSISPSLHLSLPNLTTLVLTNNSLAQLGDLEPLKDCRTLQFLNLLSNPVREKKYYRDWVIWRCKTLRVLDFMRIRERVCRCLTFRVAFNNCRRRREQSRSPYS